MSKIWSLKPWLPLPQAAQFIATLIDEFDVSEADLLHLAIDGQITLSVVFPDAVEACTCSFVDPNRVEYQTVPSLDGLRDVRLPVGGAVYETRDGRTFQIDGQVVDLPDDQPFDLLMIGGERADVQRAFWRLSGATTEDTINIDGTFVASWPERQVFQLLGRLIGADLRGSRYPLGSLPGNFVLVIRQAEVRRFVDSIAQPVGAMSGGEPKGAWPWGSHQTELLGLLAAAAQKFWVNFDPEDNTTAPTNEVVAAWLVERNVSKRLADAIASILRADGLPTGPRTSS